MIITLDASATIPAYEQIREQLADAIVGGSMVVGERLAPIRQLAVDLDIAPGTVARAYRELEASGLIHTDGRNGTFVLEAPESARRRHEEIAAIVASYARRLERYGLSASEAATLLRQQMG